MGFSGYSPDVQLFFQELNANNTKEWFEENKPRFQAEIIEPSIQLIAALGDPLSQMNLPLRAEPKVNGSIRRIYRDVRFSKDKTPYHSYLHLVFWTGDHPNKSPGVHVTLGASGFGFGAGHWGFAGDVLDRFRQSVLLDGGEALSKAMSMVEKTGVKLIDPDLKRVPKQFNTEADGANWMRYKSLVVRTSGEAFPEELFGSAAVDYIAKLCVDLAPINEYLVEHVYS